MSDKKNNALYARYKELAYAELHVIFGGRLAEYKYYDMAPIIERAPGHVDSLVQEPRPVLHQLKCQR